MDELPIDLLAALPHGTEFLAQDWWASLSNADRERVSTLWDERLEVYFFTPQLDAKGSVDAWDDLPVVECGRFLPHDDDGRGEWSEGYFEHLLEHPELMLSYDVPRRTFYIGGDLK